MSETLVDAETSLVQQMLRFSVNNLQADVDGGKFVR
jgi:hypothetical protein